MPSSRSESASADRFVVRRALRSLLAALVAVILTYAAAHAVELVRVRDPSVERDDVRVAHFGNGRASITSFDP